MAIELARRLIQSGVVAPADIDAALVDAMERGVAFIAAFAELGPVAAQLAAREVARAPVPAIHAVRGIPEIAASLPPGMCARLYAVPVRRDPRTGTVDIAAADPFDSHVSAEFVFHLGSPVRVLRAPLDEIQAALEIVDPGPIPPEHVLLDEVPDDRTPAFGTAAPGGFEHREPEPALPKPAPASEPPEVRPSDAPIPLVRRSLPPPRWERKDTNPGVGVGRVPVIEVPEVDESGEPVIGLFRSKAPPPLAQQAPDAGEADIGLALVEIAAAETPDAVVDRLIASMLPAAGRVLVLAARQDGFGGRAASRSVGDPGRVRALRILAGTASAIEAAIGGGYFMGRLDDDGAAPIADLLGSREAYVVPVMVSGRPALVLVAGEMASAFAAGRRADELARAAGEALERIVLARKRAGA